MLEPPLLRSLPKLTFSASSTSSSAAMARHALARHVGVRPASLRSSLDSLRPRVPAEQRRAAFAQLVDLFQSLAYDIKRLKGLPLGVHSLSPSCAALSGTSAATLAPHLFAGAPLDTVRQQRALSRLVPAMDVVLKFESSARWPDDLAALRATKVAFCLRIAERLAAEHKRHAVVTDDHLDVAVDGFIFRVHLAVERERTLLGRIADAAPPPATATASPASGDDEKAAAAAKAAAKAELVELEVAHTHRPALCGALQTVALRCPAYSHAVRLAKQWLSAHMLASQIDEAAVDLLVAHGFVGALTLRNEGGGRAKQRGDEAIPDGGERKQVGCEDTRRALSFRNWEGSLALSTAAHSWLAWGCPIDAYLGSVGTRCVPGTW